MENPYEWDWERLLKELVTASMNAGRSNSTAVISMTAGDDMEEMRYLLGVAFAKSEGQAPPFNLRDKVKARTGVAYSTGRNDWRHTRRQAAIEGELTVERVIYNGRGNWNVRFTERTEMLCKLVGDDVDSKGWLVPLWFDASDFEKAVQPVTA